jgi:hypothetical protein
LSRKTRRRFLVALGAVAALTAAGFAIAYFTTTGSGSGSATVGTSSALTIHGTTTATLYPGTSTPVTFTVDNPSSGHQLLGTIHLAALHACVGASSTWNGSACSNSGTEATTCEDFSNTSSSTTKNFSMADVVSNQDFGTGNGQTVTATGTLAMNDLASTQDACKNANLTLGFTS